MKGVIGHFVASTGETYTVYGVNEHGEIKVMTSYLSQPNLMPQAHNLRAGDARQLAKLLQDAANSEGTV